MRTWKCHKTVEAFKISDIGPDKGGDSILMPYDPLVEPVTVSAEYMERHKPYPGGYYVRYKDGYESFSPEQAFEQGYSLVPETPPKDELDIDRMFDYLPPNEDRAARHKQVRAGCKALAEYLNNNVPDGREQSLAITNVEQAMFWANAAIARSS